MYFFLNTLLGKILKNLLLKYNAVDTEQFIQICYGIANTQSEKLFLLW